MPTDLWTAKSFSTDPNFFAKPLASLADPCLDTPMATRTHTTNHKYLRGTARSILVANAITAAENGGFYRFDTNDEAASMVADLVSNGTSPAAARSEVNRLVNGRTHTGDRLVNRINSRLTMAPERTAAYRAHRAGKLSAAEYDAVKAATAGLFSTRQVGDDATDIVLTPKGRDFYGLPAATAGMVIGFANGNRFGTSRTIEA